MKRCYVAGPISGLPDVPLDVKLARFARAEAELIERGFEVLNPLKVEMDQCDGHCNPDKHVGQDGKPTHSWECFMRHDLRQLLTCTHIAVLPGWAESRGALIEARLATALRFIEVPLHENYLAD